MFVVARVQDVERHDLLKIKKFERFVKFRKLTMENIFDELDSSRRKTF